MEWTEEQLRAQGYERDPDHPANKGKVNKPPAESCREWRDREKVIIKVFTAYPDNAPGGRRPLRVESHGPFPEAGPPATGHGIWSGLRRDLIRLAEDEEAGRLAPRSTNTAARLREIEQQG